MSRGRAEHEIVLEVQPGEVHADQRVVPEQTALRRVRRGRGPKGRVRRVHDVEPSGDDGYMPVLEVFEH